MCLQSMYLVFLLRFKWKMNLFVNEVNFDFLLK
jgi:hypothetical protein